MRCPQRLAVALVLAVLTAALAGCRSITSRDGWPKDVAPSRKARNAELTGQFDQKREMAEFLDAQECYRRGDVAGCRRMLDPLLKRNPDHVEGHLLLAETLTAQDRCQEAIADLEPLAQRHPDHAKLQHAVGLLWDNAGNDGRAKDFFERAVRQEPGNKVYQLSYEAAARAAAVTVPAAWRPDASSVDPTRAACSGVQRAGRDEPDERKVSATGDGGDSPAASDEADRCLAAALDCLHRGSVDAAMPMIEKAMTASPHDPQIPLSAAVAALECNHPDVAIALVKPALYRFPKSAALYRVLATAHYRRGDYADSQIARQQALSLDKSSALSYFLMGCTLTRLGQNEAAAEHFRRARQIDPRFAVQQ